jgi:hypothetical protein
MYSRLLDWVDLVRGLSRYPVKFKDFDETDTWLSTADAEGLRFVEVARGTVGNSLSTVPSRGG